MAIYRNRVYHVDRLGLEQSIPSLVFEAVEKLKPVFGDVAAFGGALRTTAMKKIHGKTFPYDDIDIRVTTPKNLPAELAPAFKSMTLHPSVVKLVNPDDRIKKIFQEWSGLRLNVLKYTHKGVYFHSALPDHPDQKLDISMQSHGEELAHLPYAVATIASTPAPFASIAMEKDGTVWVNENTYDHIEKMKFDIYRDIGVRAGVAHVAYFNRMKAKYPEIALTNLRVSCVAIGKQIRDWAREQHILPTPSSHIG